MMIQPVASLSWPVKKRVAVRSLWLPALAFAVLLWPAHWAQAQPASPLPWLQSIDPDMSGLPPQSTSFHGPLFGHSMAIWNDFMIVGAPTMILEDDYGHVGERGRSYQYRRVNEQWVPDEIIDGWYSTQGHERCGLSVAMAGGLRVIGCPGMDTVLVARFNGENFAHSLGGSMVGSQFGTAVSVTGSQDTTAFVVASGPNRNQGVGSVIVYRWSAATQNWTISPVIEPQSPVGAERFGESVSISGPRMAVGAPGADQERGAVYVFEYGGNDTWSQIARITVPNAQPNDRFGRSVVHRTASGPGATGSLLVVGAPGRHTNGNTALDHRRGTVSVYRSVVTTYQSEGEVALVCALPPCTDAQAMAFGWSLAVQGDYVYAGAHLYSQDGQIDVGRVYRAERISGTWIATATYSPGPLSADCGSFGSARPEGLFGMALAATPHELVIGYPGRGCQQNTIPPSPPGPRRGQVRVFGITDGVFNDRFE